MIPRLPRRCFLNRFHMLIGSDDPLNVSVGSRRHRRVRFPHSAQSQLCHREHSVGSLGFAHCRDVRNTGPLTLPRYDSVTHVFETRQGSLARDRIVFSISEQLSNIWFIQLRSHSGSQGCGAARRFTRLHSFVSRRDKQHSGFGLVAGRQRRPYRSSPLSTGRRRGECRGGL